MFIYIISYHSPPQGVALRGAGNGQHLPRPDGQPAQRRHDTPACTTPTQAPPCIQRPLCTAEFLQGVYIYALAISTQPQQQRIFAPQKNRPDTLITPQSFRASEYIIAAERSFIVQNVKLSKTWIPSHFTTGVDAHQAVRLNSIAGTQLLVRLCSLA